LIEADWEDPALSGGHALLAHMHELARALGPVALRHHVDAPAGPPQYQENESARVRLLTEPGYQLDRDGLRWLVTDAAAPAPLGAPSLAFRDLTQTGEEAFVEALAATYEGTRDSILARHIEERLVLEAARSDFSDYQELYVGVVPSQRGRGYAQHSSATAWTCSSRAAPAKFGATATATTLRC
jgi:hypothetical protein